MGWTRSSLGTFAVEAITGQLMRTFVETVGDALGPGDQVRSASREVEDLELVCLPRVERLDRFLQCFVQLLAQRPPRLVAHGGREPRRESALPGGHSTNWFYFPIAKRTWK